MELSEAMGRKCKRGVHTAQIVKEFRIFAVVGDIIQDHEKPAARGADGLHDRGKEQHEEGNEGLHAELNRPALPIEDGNRVLFNCK